MYFSDENAKKIDVIISGGFHTTGISKLLELNVAELEKQLNLNS